MFHHSIQRLRQRRLWWASASHAGCLQGGTVHVATPTHFHSLSSRLQKLERVFGLTNCPGNVVNLGHGEGERIAYMAGHTVVVLDCQTGKQSFLQVRVFWGDACICF